MTDMARFGGSPPGQPCWDLVTGDNRPLMVSELSGKPVSLDVETVGTDPWQPGSRLRMVQLAAGPGHAWIDFTPGRAIADILAGAPAILGHNVSFDLLWLERFGIIPVGGWEDRTVDTLHLAHLKDNRVVRTPFRSPEHDEWDQAASPEQAEEDGPGHGLKDLAAHYLGPDADIARRRLWERYQLPTGGSEFTAAWAAIPDDDPVLLAYAAADVDLVWRLLPHLTPREDERPLVDLERRVAAVAARIIRRGFAVDTTQVMRARSACRDELAQTMPVLLGRRIDTLGATGRGAEQAVRALLAEGAPLTKRTPGGRYSVDREVLDGLSTAGYELAGLLRRARRADRYQRDYLDKMHANRGIDGRIRPTINTLGARTGRWTVGGALPLQQIPQAPGLRECLIADSGNVLVSFDYRGIEFVTLAAITRDPGMLAVITSGSDPHLAAADVIWPGTALLSPKDPDRGRRRQQAKQFTHGLGYGMGPATLAARSGLTLAEARLARDQLRAAWPGAHQAMTAIEDSYWRGERELTSPYGRRYRIPERDSRPVVHRALNNLNQGTARDLMMYDLVRLEDLGLQPWMTIHDEIIVECPAGDAENVVAAMTNVMARAAHPVLGVPIRVDGGILGPAWRAH